MRGRSARTLAMDRLDPRGENPPLLLSMTITIAKYTGRDEKTTISIVTRAGHARSVAKELRPLINLCKIAVDALNYRHKGENYVGIPYECTNYDLMDWDSPP